MGDRVTGDRVEKTPRRELDRKDLDAVLVGGVLTDARAPTRAAGVQGIAAGGGPSSSLTMEELDGDPSVGGVRKIVVPNDRLTDDEGGQVTLEFGSLAVEELDGDPSVEDVTKIIFPNGSVVDNEDGSVTISELAKIKVWRVVSAPTPLTPESVLNFWDSTGNGHLHFYSNVSLSWLRLSGYV